MLTADPSALIDKFMPSCDFRAAYDIHVQARSSVVYECLLRTDFSEHWVVRLLMTLRSGKRMPRNQSPGDIRQRVQGTGFVLLADIPNKELLLGVAGRFWRLDGGRCLDLNADGFPDFSRHGDAKAAWNFVLQAESPQSTILSTETRIQCFGAAALWKFRAYWTLVGPFSGLIRKAILQQIKAKAELEQGARLNGPNAIANA